MVCLRSLFPAGRNRTFYRRIFFLDVVRQLCVHIIGSCRLRIEAEYIIEFSKHIIHNRFLILHGEHPDAEIFRFIFLTELRTRKAQQRQCYLIAVFFVVFLCDLDRLFIEERCICHLDRRLKSVLMRSLLLKSENIKRLREKRFSSDVFFLPVAGHLLGILRHHLGTMNYIYNKLVHSIVPNLSVSVKNLS